jgi:hypothetical protein
VRTSCPEVGRSQRPDLIANQRGGRRLSSSANAQQTRLRLANIISRRRCLTDDDRPRYPRSEALTPPTETAEAPYFDVEGS